MEPVEFPKKQKKHLPAKNWALTGADGRERRIVKSFFPVKGELEVFNAHFAGKNTAWWKAKRSAMRRSTSTMQT